MGFNIKALAVILLSPPINKLHLEVIEKSRNKGVGFYLTARRLTKDCELELAKYGMSRKSALDNLCDFRIGDWHRIVDDTLRHFADFPGFDSDRLAGVLLNVIQPNYDTDMAGSERKLYVFSKEGFDFSLPALVQLARFDEDGFREALN